MNFPSWYRVFEVLHVKVSVKKENVYSDKIWYLKKYELCRWVSWLIIYHEYDYAYHTSSLIGLLWCRAALNSLYILPCFKKGATWHFVSPLNWSHCMFKKKRSTWAAITCYRNKWMEAADGEIINGYIRFFRFLLIQTIFSPLKQHRVLM